MSDSYFHPDQVDVDWSRVPYDPYRPEAADPETKALAGVALACLTPAERLVVELAYGFRGDAKTDEEVAEIVGDTRGAVKKRRQRALEKMRGRLDPVPD